jgi:hypothetical protein
MAPESLAVKTPDVSEFSAPTDTKVSPTPSSNRLTSAFFLVCSYRCIPSDRIGRPANGSLRRESTMSIRKSPVGGGFLAGAAAHATEA